MGRLSAIVVSMAVLVGVVGAAVALQGHGGEDLLLLRQSAMLRSHPATMLSAARVEALLAKAPEPVAHALRTPPATVRCQPSGDAPLRDPWICEIRYRSGTRAHYRVVVQPSGYYRGVGSGIIEGCCVKTPTAG